MEAIVKKNLALLEKRFPLLAAHFDSQASPATTESIELPSLKGVSTLFFDQPLPDALDALTANPHLNAVFVFDSPNKLNTFLKQPKTTALLENPSVFCYWMDPLLKKLSEMPEYLLRGKLAIASNDPDFSSVVKYTSQAVSGFHSEMLSMGISFFRNYYFNLLKLPTSFLASGLLSQFKQVPAIICGAGPSLAKNLPLLETLKERALIFAGGSAMNAVNANGFLPHFGVGIDPNPAQIDRLATNSAFSVPYFYRNRMHPEALRLIAGPKLFVGGSGGYPISKWFEETLGLNEPDLEEGNNVVNFSLSIAEKLGCDPIIFVGVDLCYGDRESYAPGVNRFALSEHPLATKSQEDEVIIKSDIYGESKLTLWKWINESLFITGFAKDHPHLKLINATEGGIGIAGVENKTLAQVKEAYLSKTHTLDQKINALLQHSKMPKSVSIDTILEAMQALKKSLREEKKDPAWNYLLKDFQQFFYRFIGKKQEEPLTDTEKSDLENYLKKVAASNQQLLNAGLLLGKSMKKAGINAKKPVLPYKQGKLHGIVKIFDDDGNLFREIAFENGKRNGIEKWFFSNGNIQCEMEYKDNNPVKDACRWDASGQLRLKITRDSAGKILSAEHYSSTGELQHTHKPSDFFQDAFSKTEKLQKTITHLVEKFGKVATQFEGVDLANDLETIANELKNLTALEKKLHDEEESEPIWKTPLAKSLIAEKITEAYEAMGKEILHMQELLKKLKKKH